MRKLWIEAAITLLKDPNSQVLCPNCMKSVLKVIDSSFDEEFPEKGGERHLLCENCGSYNSILLRKPPSKWGND